MSWRLKTIFLCLCWQHLGLAYPPPHVTSSHFGANTVSHMVGWLDVLDPQPHWRSPKEFGPNTVYIYGRLAKYSLHKGVWSDAETRHKGGGVGLRTAVAPALLLVQECGTFWIHAVASHPRGHKTDSCSWVDHTSQKIHQIFTKTRPKRHSSAPWVPPQEDQDPKVLFGIPEQRKCPEQRLTEIYRVNSLWVRQACWRELRVIIQHLYSWCGALFLFHWTRLTCPDGRVVSIMDP